MTKDMEVGMTVEVAGASIAPITTPAINACCVPEIAGNTDTQYNRDDNTSIATGSSLESTTRQHFPVAAEHREAQPLSLPPNELERIPWLIKVSQDAVDCWDIPTVLAILDDKKLAYYLKSRDCRGVRDSLRHAADADRRKHKRKKRREEKEIKDLVADACGVRVDEETLDYTLRHSSDAKLPEVYTYEQSIQDELGRHSDEHGDRSNGMYSFLAEK